MLNTLAHILHVSKGSQSVLYDPRVCIDPLNPLCIGKQNAKGFRMTPCNLSEAMNSNIISSSEKYAPC